MKEYVLGIEATIEIFGGKWKTLIGLYPYAWYKKNK